LQADLKRVQNSIKAAQNNKQKIMTQNALRVENEKNRLRSSEEEGKKTGLVNQKKIYV
jgi:hypothetical protein